jgi:hypothetical protein
VYQLERTVDLMPPGVENLCLCIDFGASQGGGQPTSVGQARTVLHSMSSVVAEMEANPLPSPPDILLRKVRKTVTMNAS